MPRHLISDAHEWINEIPTVPIYYLAKPQPRERTWENQLGTERERVMIISTHPPWEKDVNGLVKGLLYVGCTTHTIKAKKLLFQKGTCIYKMNRPILW